MTENEAWFYELKRASDSIRPRLNAAIAQDEVEAETFWANLRALASHGWNYNAERARFNATVDGLKKRALDAAQDIESRVSNRFESFKLHPGALEADARAWRDRSEKADALAGRLVGMQSVDGWTGRAADQYADAVKVQTSAVRELAGVMLGASTGAREGANLHRWLFALARNAVDEALTLADVDRPPLGDTYYLRTAGWGDVLIGVPDVLDQIADLKNVEAAVEYLSSQLDQSLSIAHLLDPGTWPTGTDAAGILPADTRSAVTDNADEHADFEPPPSRHPGVCLPGAER